MIEPLRIDEWQAFDAAHPAPTFFARPAWALALAHAYPHLRPYPVRVVLRDTAFIIPLVARSASRLGWRELIGMPLGAYTAVRYEDGTAVPALDVRRAIAALGRACDTLTVIPWPLESWDPPPSWQALRHETAVIDLEHGAQAALRAFDGVTRRMAGQAVRRGVECVRSSSALAPGTYYAMLRETASRWAVGRPSFPKELLDALVALGGADVEIWFAQCDGHPIAGGVVLYGARELFFWSAAMRREYAHLRASNALNAALIEAAAQRGVRWYNLGSSEGLPGVERFKRGLGASPVTYQEIRRDRMAFSLYTRLRATLKHARLGHVRLARASPLGAP